MVCLKYMGPGFLEQTLMPGWDSPSRQQPLSQIFFQPFGCRDIWYVTAGFLEIWDVKSDTLSFWTISKCFSWENSRARRESCKLFNIWIVLWVRKQLFHQYLPPASAPDFWFVQCALSSKQYSEDWGIQPWKSRQLTDWHKICSPTRDYFSYLPTTSIKFVILGPPSESNIPGLAMEHTGHPVTAARPSANSQDLIRSSITVKACCSSAENVESLVLWSPTCGKQTHCWSLDPAGTDPQEGSVALSPWFQRMMAQGKQNYIPSLL